ncbi:unnamed protein product [Heterotrigona itama]|uniref:PiggyBac transposable element-derived protein domain-containing protein n=1 Tax=Heterotrigona itama TaxID=395501 RepID=A0A6V7HDP7_9HYME|nr:unnamed protein product [Heterotrigona itama]
MIVAYRQKDKLLLSWRDKRIVTMLSTCATSSMKTITKRTRKEGTTGIVKPSVVINYNKYMGGVDKADQKKHNTKKLTHLQFVHRLVDELIGGFHDTDPKNPSTSETGERLNSLLHIIRRDDTGRSKDCVRKRSACTFSLLRAPVPLVHSDSRSSGGCDRKGLIYPEMKRSNVE